MTIDWWTLGLQAVNVAILVWILARFLFRPVAKIIGERQAAARSALDEAQAALADAKAERAAAAAETEALRARKAALVKDAEDEAERERKRLLDEAEADIAAKRAKLEAALDKERDQQMRALSDEASTLAADIAERLLARLPDDARIAGFIDALVAAVADLPEATRAGLAQGGPVAVRAARALTSEEHARLSEGLAKVLGRAPDIDVTVDPSLIAGLELDAADAVVRNHFRADLDRIKTGLLDHG